MRPLRTYGKLALFGRGCLAVLIGVVHTAKDHDANIDIETEAMFEKATTTAEQVEAIWQAYEKWERRLDKAFSDLFAQLTPEAAKSLEAPTQMGRTSRRGTGVHRCLVRQFPGNHVFALTVIRKAGVHRGVSSPTRRLSWHPTGALAGSCRGEEGRSLTSFAQVGIAGR